VCVSVCVCLTVCACVRVGLSVCGLETSTMTWPRLKLDCSATEKKIKKTLETRR
jgi:hypothetical protein